MGNCLSISISVDPAGCRCWNCVAGQARYICKLEQNLQALEAEAKRLTEQRDDVNRRVLLAKEQLMEPLKRVEGWLERVEKEIKEVEQIIGDAPAQIDNLCLGGYFSQSCCSSYKFGKKVVQKTRDVANLRTEGDFQDVAERCPAASVVVRSSEPTVGLESTFDKVWACLTDEGSNIIGLYGMGGVGKTTLLNHINNELGRRRNNFDIVIWATVSKNHTVEKVQDEIGGKIGYSDQRWKQKSYDEKATDILAVLSKKKFVLLLDDIWERVDLVKVGIPIPRQGNGSKLIFTTRSLDVCGQMEAHEKIVVDCLAPEKAWELFQIKVGEETLDGHPQIRGLAKEMAEECKGLPLALITVGRAMSSKKTLEQWEYARRILRRSVANHVLPGMRKDVYPLLKFSYDNLPDDKLKSCFLYCALFPEDFLISKCELIDYWIAEGFLDEDDIICDRNEGHNIICTLLGSCLLEEVDVEQVKMHDVIRDMALWIASEIEKEKYIVKTSAQLTEALEIENWGMIKRLSLMNNGIQSLRGAPDCPDLQTLFLENNWLLSMRLGKDFFQNMVSLTVLNLSSNLSLTELPVGISNLDSLQCLNISRTFISELPMELSSLSKLKCLNLERTLRLETIPEKLIYSFSRLQVLRMGKTGYWASREINGNLSFSRLECLECLKYLNALTITICSDSALEGFLSFHHLQGCTEELYIDQPEDDSFFSLKTLCLPPMKRLQFLSLELTSLEEVKIDWEKEGREIQTAYYFQTSVIVSEGNFYNLWTVEIQFCPNLKDITWIIFAPNLRNLFVSDCRGMEEIISEGGAAEMTGDLILFEKLQNLVLSSLPELKRIHRFALSFPCLVAIRVFDCPKLRKIPLSSNSAKGRRIIIIGKQQWWNELEWEDESARDTFLPSFQIY
ncbi:hypothetical protein SLEP1_g37283 [Rubroshorea leprosula]|uniref:AAA+ ATPase domain-containing protein n=1 Tax=Rubroshorea leprosula TaxID=152421 RepID=A0AAV5KU99_9ROSI|nr:hypothetical protein SLEP1_g37283 [Rubroshorea leprosula]